MLFPYFPELTLDTRSCMYNKAQIYQRKHEISEVLKPLVVLRLKYFSFLLWSVVSKISKVTQNNIFRLSLLNINSSRSIATLYSWTPKEKSCNFRSSSDSKHLCYLLNFMHKICSIMYYASFIDIPMCCCCDSDQFVHTLNTYDFRGDRLYKYSWNILSTHGSND